MEPGLLLATDSWIIVILLFILMLIFIYLGYKFGKSVKKKSGDSSGSLLTSGIYSLMGLLLAFTFTMSGTRFDSRIKIIVEEANDIGTAILRIQMYPDSIRTLFKEDFKNYVDARIEYAEARDDIRKSS